MLYSTEKCKTIQNSHNSHLFVSKQIQKFKQVKKSRYLYFHVSEAFPLPF